MKRESQIPIRRVGRFWAIKFAVKSILTLTKKFVQSFYSMFRCWISGHKWLRVKKKYLTTGHPKHWQEEECSTCGAWKVVVEKE